MADLVSHVACGLIVKGATRGPLTSAMIAGTILPDIGARVPALGFSALGKLGIEIPTTFSYIFEALHMPLGLLLACYLISLVFVVEQRRTAFLNLLGGAGLHLALDLAQHHLGVGYLLLFPFSTADFEFGWIGTEATVYAAPALGPAAWFFWRIRTGSQRSSAEES